jgi:hypothetical protein
LTLAVKGGVYITVHYKDSTTSSVYRYNIDPGNQFSKIYVSFGSRQGKLTLYPQTGTFKGLSGKTDSGLSLKGNVTETEIHDTTDKK